MQPTSQHWTFRRRGRLALVVVFTAALAAFDVIDHRGDEAMLRLAVFAAAGALALAVSFTPDLRQDRERRRAARLADPIWPRELSQSLIRILETTGVPGPVRVRVGGRALLDRAARVAVLELAVALDELPPAAVAPIGRVERLISDPGSALWGDSADTLVREAASIRLALDLVD